jgi:ABC-type antimicrobial peptide transport system permease subunit
MASTIRARIHELEPLRSVYDIALLEDQIEGAFAQNRLRTTILVAFAATALSLACVGLYGMLSYVVSLRRKEIGLRLALGAARPGIVRQFVFQAIRVVLLACAGGVALSFVFARLLAGMLYGVSASDPLTLSTVVVIVLAVAILAALVPATRAARLEPMEVLRDG